jgi:hypothetical protein
MEAAKRDRGWCPVEWCSWHGGSPAIAVQAELISLPQRAGRQGIIAQRRDGFQRHVAGALDGPLVVLLEQDGADQANDGIFVGKMPTTSVRRLISPLSRSTGLDQCSLARCCAGEAHIDEHIRLRLIHEGGELWHLGTELIGDLAPLRLGCLVVVLGEGCGDQGGDDAASALACMGQDVAHEMHTATMPSGVECLGYGGLDALVGVRQQPSGSRGVERPAAQPYLASC